MPRSLCLFCLTVLRIVNCQLTSSDVLVMEVLEMDTTVDCLSSKDQGHRDPSVLSVLWGISLGSLSLCGFGEFTSKKPPKGNRCHQGTRGESHWGWGPRDFATKVSQRPISPPLGGLNGVSVPVVGSRSVNGPLTPAVSCSFGVFAVSKAVTLRSGVRMSTSSS